MSWGNGPRLPKTGTPEKTVTNWDGRREVSLVLAQGGFYTEKR